MDLQLLGLERGDWICLAQDWDNRQGFAKMAVKIRISQKAGNLLKRRGTVSFSKGLYCT